MRIQPKDQYKRLGFKIPAPEGFELLKAVCADDVRESPWLEARKKSADRLFEELGGWDRLMGILEFVQEDSARLLLAAMSHPEYRAKSPVFVLVGCGIKEAQFRVLVGHGMAAKTRFDAQAATVPKVSAVIEDLADDSVGKYVICPSCAGEGVEEDGKACGTCHGELRVKLRADPKARELFLKQAGLIQEGGGVSLTINQTLKANMASLPSLEDVVRQGKRLPEAAIDAEVVQ